MTGGHDSSLFAIETGKGMVAYRLYATSILVSTCLVWWYRATHIPSIGEKGRWLWIGISLAEMFTGLYWIVTQFLRLNPIYRHAFPDRLSQRYSDKQLPGVDVFVCTADPTSEPPSMVNSTILSVMAYDYPSEKLNVYLSDDAGSILTFYALWEASEFAKVWLPFCRRYKIEPRSPAAYFSNIHSVPDTCSTKEWYYVKELYENMVIRINTVVKKGKVPEEVLANDNGFSKWNEGIAPKDHPSIVQILVDGKGYDAVEKDGIALPTLVYVAREKRSGQHHNFKAGAMNALIRVSSVISNSPIILNVDCDMHSNNSKCIREALCFLLDEEKGQNIAFVQYPQDFANLDSYDIYGNSLTVYNALDFPGIDGWGGSPYIGTGCFHRREALCGRPYSKDYKENWAKGVVRISDETISDMEERAKSLATCTFELDTEWGNGIGLKYGYPVEDVVTGLQIKCRGWKSAYCNPKRTAFLGLSPTTLEQCLVQYKRWSEGNLQIFLSMYNAILVGHRKLCFGLIMCYYMYGLWATTCFPTWYYVVIPSLCFLQGIPLFPEVTSIWVLPFIYITSATYILSLAETVRFGGTIIGWWNFQRMWLIKRITSFSFATIDTALKFLGWSEMSFSITEKVTDDSSKKRYEQRIIEFGSASAYFVIIASVALLNLFCLVGGFGAFLVNKETERINKFFIQGFLCAILVVINLPVYEALFLRKDNGRLPFSVLVASVGLTMLVVFLPL
ncbi:Cellulose synthase family protein [Rhynchospora pubera]|uniref:Cellulose synthase family protein n=1 Tax=Rhynchospora pubera TaxID=906938 RepID=A0AAV8CG57_9POAL|nr:Cellulose synthase family protein [Rhynchospora pubera]